MNRKILNREITIMNMALYAMWIALSLLIIFCNIAYDKVLIISMKEFVFCLIVAGIVNISFSYAERNPKFDDYYGMIFPGTFFISAFLCFIF